MQAVAFIVLVLLLVKLGKLCVRKRQQWAKPASPYEMKSWRRRAHDVAEIDVPLLPGR